MDSFKRHKIIFMFCIQDDLSRFSKVYYRACEYQNHSNAYATLIRAIIFQCDILIPIFFDALPLS